MLPGGLRNALLEALRGLGDETGILAERPVGGGCINQVRRLETGAQTYLLKWSDNPMPGAFTNEARGLELMRETHSARVPGVYAISEAGDGHPAFILQEWLAPASGDPSGANMSMLGEQLAAMHRHPAPNGYGLDHDNWIGASPQVNGWDGDWVRFFREQRLRFQVELAVKNRHLPAARRARLEAVMARLDGWLGGVPRQPSLLHGDLWGGNVIAGPGGAPVLIDPAVYYGDREAEIAYTELFGGFDRRFYEAYSAAWPLEPGYRERRDLYNLYHLLNHLNIFGESYGGAVDAVARRYTG